MYVGLTVDLGTLAHLGAGMMAAGCFYGCAADKQVQGATKKTPTEASVTDDDAPREELSLEEILRQCGVKPEDLDDKDKVVFEKTIRSWPKVFTGQSAAPIVGNVNYRVAVTTVITIRATVGGTEQNVDFEIQATPSQAAPKARAKTEPNRGSTVSTSLTTDERATLLGESSDWDGIVCTVQPIKELSTNKGGKGKIVSFNPPLPGSVSPKADPARYQAEIGQGRTFSGITAKVVGSTDDAVRQGETFSGSVTITPVSPTLTIQIGSAATKTVNADAAYKIVWDFGSVADTVKLGLMPVQTMYITHGDRDIKAIVADTGFVEGGTVVLIDGL